jgi:hypothetical protein
LENLGINENTELDALIIDGVLIVKPRTSTKSEADKLAELEKSADAIMDKYRPVFKKLSKT